LICYVILVIRCAPEASRFAAIKNARQAMREEFSAEKRTKEKVVEQMKKEKKK